LVTSDTSQEWKIKGSHCGWTQPRPCWELPSLSARGAGCASSASSPLEGVLSPLCPLHGLGGEASPLEQDSCPPAMIQEHPAPMHKDTRRYRGCWEVMVKSVVLGVDKPPHSPASLPLPGKQPKRAQQSTLQPVKPLLLSCACCEGWLEGLRRHSTRQRTTGVL